MISATRRWFRRNRTNFAIGAGLLGVGYLAGQYLLGKLTEARQRMGDERAARENLRRRFEQNQDDCTFTVLAILPTATQNILKDLPVEQTLAELQKQRAQRLQQSVATSDIGSTEAPSETASAADDDCRSSKSFQSDSIVHASQLISNDAREKGGDELQPVLLKPKRSKAQLWDDMKVHSITRAFTLLYTLSLLTLFTRIQLNLLGRRNYLASVVTLATPSAHGLGINMENHDDDNLEQSYGNDFETNRRYLSFSWWLLHRGYRDIMDMVATTVKDVFGPLNPREEITFERLSQLTLQTRRRIEGETEQARRTRKWLPYILPPADKESYVLSASGMSADDRPTNSERDTPLRRLLDETSDIIDSPSFAHVLTILLDTTFSVLIDSKIATLSYKIPPDSADATDVVDLTDLAAAKAKIAHMLPVFCRQAHVIGGGINNEYLSAMDQVRDLEAFAAVVYSSNFDFEPPEDVGRGTENRPTTPGTLRSEETRTRNRDTGFDVAWDKAVDETEASGEVQENSVSSM